VPIYRSRAVTGFEQDENGVDVVLDGGQALRAHYLVGCDGGRSLVRKLAGIEFAGWEASVSSLIAEAELAEAAEFGLHADEVGTQAMGPMGEGNKVRIVLTQRYAGQSDPTVDDLKAGLVAVFGSDYGVHNVTWLSRFTDMARQAVAYRDGRVLLAGDAAHVHSPVGGQGLNIGVQDAVNLGWKLAQVVKGISPERLLDTYHAERHPIAARVLRNTLAQIALGRGDERTKALNEIMGEVLAMDAPRKRFAGMMSGLDVHYDLGEGHPLLGRRMPDLDLVTADGAIRLYSLLHEARPVLIGFDENGWSDTGPWADRVQAVRADCNGTWELPVLGTVEAPGAVLIRPDGYVAWVGDGKGADPTGALETWFGPR
jgi:3-(3-hydroxy-phenyl)propionate hydroxylase